MDQKRLIKHLIANNVLKSENIISAFGKIDRADFVPEQYLHEAYEDHPLQIGFGQTISQPTTVAFMLELLQPNSGDKILDVGTGSGWTTALLASIVGQKGRVFGVEIIPELAEFGRKNLAKYKFPNAKILQSGEKLGLPMESPFDKILVSAAAEENLPEDLIAQLKIGGRMVLPIKNSIWKIDKISDNETNKEEFPGFVFVPLK